MKLFFTMLILSLPLTAFSGEATDLIEKAEKQLQGKEFQATMTMSVVRGSSERNLQMRIWLKGRDNAVVKILSPIKDRGTGNLRLNLNLWQYLPNVERLVKIPPSMMLQNWMGSDFTNDDIVKTSSLARDYTHTIQKKTEKGGQTIVEILCTPKPNAPVVWGKVVEFIRQKDAALVRREFYNEKNELVRVLVGEEIKLIDGHSIPTVMTMSSPKKEGNKTVVRYEDIKFDQGIETSIFTQEFLRKPIKD